MIEKSHEELLDEVIGKKGTEERERFEDELRAEVLAYRIKELRKNKHLTHSQLADKLGMDKTHISKIESGKQNLTIQSINRILRALDARIQFELNPI